MSRQGDGGRGWGVNGSRRWHVAFGRNGELQGTHPFRLLAAVVQDQIGLVNLIPVLFQAGVPSREVSIRSTSAVIETCLVTIISPVVSAPGTDIILMQVSAVRYRIICKIPDNEVLIVQLPFEIAGFDVPVAQVVSLKNCAPV